MKQRILGILLLAGMFTGCGNAPLQLESDTMSEMGMLERTTAAPTEEPTTEPEPTTEEETLPPVTEPVIPPPETIDGDIVMRNNVLVVNSGTDHARAIELYGGKDEAGARFADVLNAFKGRVSGAVNMYCMVVPTSAAFYVPEERADSCGDQAAQYENIVSNLIGVTGVPLYEPLLYHRDEPIYSRTDFHWQPLGAYYAAAELAKAADVPFAELETYEKTEREGYVGAFAAVNKIDELYNAPETFVYYKPANYDTLECYYYNTDFTNERSGSLLHEDLPTSSSYTVIVGTDECIFRAETGADNGRVLVIFKDSYGNALVPFLTDSFSTIYLCDFRFFNTDAAAFVENVNATDVVFAMSTVACTTPAKVDTLAGNLGV